MAEQRPGMESLTDGQLVERLRDGDLSAFRELVNRYKKRAFYLAYRLLSDREAAEDISQEAFIRVYKKIKEFRGDTSFQNWFYRIILNLSRSHLRHRYFINRFVLWFKKAEEGEIEKSLETLPSPPSPESNPLQAALARERKERIDSAIQSLQGNQREIFVLKHIEGMKIKNIAEILNLKEGTVKIHLFRAVQKLQEALKEYREVQ